MMQPDEVVPDLLNPQALNRYAYAYNNPVRYTDPSGYSPNDTEDKIKFDFEDWDDQDPGPGMDAGAKGCAPCRDPSRDQRDVFERVVFLTSALEYSGELAGSLVELELELLGDIMVEMPLSDAFDEEAVANTSVLLKLGRAAEILKGIGAAGDVVEVTAGVENVLSAQTPAARAEAMSKLGNTLFAIGVGTAAGGPVGPAAEMALDRLLATPLEPRLESALKSHFLFPWERIGLGIGQGYAYRSHPYTGPYKYRVTPDIYK